MKTGNFHAFSIFLTILATFFIAQAGLAATYYVSPDGTAAWSLCTSMYSPCSLATANANAVAGDVVVLRGGQYSMHIFPAHSGTSVNSRITYQAYAGETPIIANTTEAYGTYYHGITLGGRAYIKVDGVTVNAKGVPSGKYRPLMITHGGSYNEIVNCTIDGNGSAEIQIWDGVSSVPDTGTPCVHNWIHNSTIRNTGSVGADCNDNGGMQIGVPAYDKNSGNNTIENNVFYGGGHHNLETFTKYNVIRNNYFHHEGSMASPGGCPYGPDTNGKYGNRNIQIYDGYAEDGKYNLIEGNRFGHAGPPPDDDGGDGLTITAPKNIIRYNAIFNSLNNGVLFKTGYNSLADYNRFYNNTIYKSGRYKNAGDLWQGANFRWYGGYVRVGNVIKNNILNTYGGASEWMHGDVNIYVNNTATNNFCSPQEDVVKKCYAFGDPMFVNPDVSNPFNWELPNLTPQNPSVINAGIHLATTVGSGAGTTLIVTDALCFQDGTWGSALSNRQADWIAIGSVDNVVQISSINYSTNTITLASFKSWADGAKVWLFKKSDGAQVLYGPAPDVGAYETGSMAPAVSVAVETNTPPPDSSTSTDTVIRTIKKGKSLGLLKR